MADMLKPSDLVRSAADEIGSAMLATRTQALTASGADRDRLWELYDELKERMQSLIVRELKAIDKDPRINSLMQELGDLAHLLAKTKREMTTVKKAIDGAIKIVGYGDQILGLILKVGVI